MIYQILTAISALISLLLIIDALYMKHSKNTVIFALLILQFSIFTSDSFMELAVKDNTAKILWKNISQACFWLAMPTILLLMIIYLGKENILKTINLVLIYLFPVSGILFRWTDRCRYLIVEDVYVKKGQLAVIFNSFALSPMLSELTMILFSIVLLLTYYKNFNLLNKKPHFVMVTGVLIPVLTSIIKITKPDLYITKPLVAVTFILTGMLLLFWIIFRYQSAAAMPLARTRILDYIQEGIITADSSGIIIDKNSAADRFIADTFGETAKLSGENLEHVLMNNWPRWYLSCKNMQEDEFEIHTLKWGKRRYYYVKVYPVYKKNLKKLGTVSVLTDITGRKIREGKPVAVPASGREELEELTEEISRQKKQMETIINTISDMAYLLISDRDGNFIYYSNNVKENFSNNQYNLKDFMHTAYHNGMFYYQDGRKIDLEDMPVLKVLQGEKVINFHFIMKKTDKENHLLFNGTPIYDKRGSLIYGVYFVQDITENIMHRNLITVTEHLTAMNALKDKLFTVFMHDIRNPIATMVSMIDMMEQDKEWHNEDYREILDEVKKQVNYTYDIIENLLEWLNSQRNGLVFKPSFWNLTKIVQETLSIYQIGAGVKGIRISCNIDENIQVYTDRKMLELVLRNLLSNAVKFTRQGGNITIEAYVTDRESIIAVKDTGIGMDSDKVQKLFQEGYASSTLGTAGEKGIGLGLLICKEFITKGGGKIWAESTPGKGSTFYISLLTANKN